MKVVAVEVVLEALLVSGVLVLEVLLEDAVADAADALVAAAAAVAVALVAAVAEELCLWCRTYTVRASWGSGAAWTPTNATTEAIRTRSERRAIDARREGTKARHKLACGGVKDSLAARKS